MFCLHFKPILSIFPSIKTKKELKKMPINIIKYFERIGYKGSTEVSVETLTAIHTHQVFSIPFENLAIHELTNVNNTNDFIPLTEDALFQKLVVERRGGYCYENNELLALVLTQLGFKVDRLLARVLTTENLPRSHKLLMVTIGASIWIADVGFGGYGLLEPIPLVINKEFTQYHDRFKLDKQNDKYILQVSNENTWKDLYEFNLEVFQPVDYVPLSYHMSHNPKSFFVQNRVCVIATPNQRVTLYNFILKIIRPERTETILLKSELEYFETLKKYFGINLNENMQLKSIDTQTKKSDNYTAKYHFFKTALITAGIAGTAYLVSEYAKYNSV